MAPRLCGFCMQVSLVHSDRGPAQERPSGEAAICEPFSSPPHARGLPVAVTAEQAGFGATGLGTATRANPAADSTRAAAADTAVAAAAHAAPALNLSAAPLIASDEAGAGAYRGARFLSTTSVFTTSSMLHLPYRLAERLWQVPPLTKVLMSSRTTAAPGTMAATQCTRPRPRTLMGGALMRMRLRPGLPVPLAPPLLHRLVPG